MNLKKKALIALAAMTLGNFSNVYAEEENSPTTKEQESATVEEQEPNFQTKFKNPSADNRPLTRWWVPGSRMTKDEIRAEIESMAAAGFGGAAVASSFRRSSA